MNTTRATALVLALLTPMVAGQAEWRGGICVLGDSGFDEHRFYPVHWSTARNWVEILTMTHGV